MKKHAKQFYLPAAILLGLLICIGLFAVWERGESRTIYAQGPTGPLQEKTMSTREDLTTGRLNSMLFGDGISAREGALLPTRVESSKTALVRLRSVDAAAGETHEARLPQNSELKLIAVQKNKGSLARQRSLDLSPNQLFVAAVGHEKQMLWWSLMPDPRVFYAETAGPNGTLSGQVLYKTSADVLIAYPDDPGVAELRLYHPAWDGRNYHLEPIGSVLLAQNK